MQWGGNKAFRVDGTLSAARRPNADEDASNNCLYSSGIIAKGTLSKTWGYGNPYVTFTSSKKNILARISFGDHSDRISSPCGITISGNCNVKVITQTASNYTASVAYLEAEITNISGAVKITRSNSGTFGGMTMVAMEI